METILTAVVIDDHPFFRDGVSRGLTQSGRVKVLGEASNGRDGLDLIREHRPMVALIDYQMPDVDGLQVIRAITRDKLTTRGLLLSAITDGPVVYQALQEGARGYLAKDATREEIVSAVIAVAKGKTVVPPELAAGLVDQIRLRTDTAGPVLTERENQVLRGFSHGKSIPQIATELFLGVNTIKTHTQRLYEKLGVSDRAEAVAEGMRRGLLE